MNDRSILRLLTVIGGTIDLIYSSGISKNGIPFLIIETLISKMITKP